MTVGYIISFVCAVGLLIAYMILVKNKEFWLTMLYVCVSVVNLGYMLLSMAPRLELALLANDVAYLGSVFLSMCMFLTIVRLCGFEIKRLHVILCVSLGVLMFAIVATSGFLPLYYDKVRIEIVDGATRLIKDKYGPLHNVYLVYLMGYFAAMIGTILHSAVTKKIGRPKFAGFIAGVVCGNLIVWVFEKFVDWEFEFLAVTYIASELTLLLVYWMMQDYVHKKELPEAAAEQPQSERLLALSAEKGLTAKEREILERMVAGQSRKEMAAELHVSENTVKTHVKHVYEKLGVSGKEEIQMLLHETLK